MITTIIKKYRKIGILECRWVQSIVIDMKLCQCLFSLLVILLVVTVVANEEIDSKNDPTIENELLKKDSLLVLNDGKKH
jgi:hypothetical protein